MDMIPFDLLKNPIRGARLIEASAGTGKTYAIAGLYVRLIVERALPVKEILVVTFTLAATAELKDRIRRKLRDALKAFSREDIGDEFLQALVEAFPGSAACSEACERLRAALRDFDEAAIYTIHGFCQRMLHEHAFESGALFDTELVTDQRRLRDEIIMDFWRTRFYGALPELVGYALGQRISPAALLPESGSLALNPDIRIIPEVEPPSPETIRASLDAFHEAAAALQGLWPESRQEVRQKLQDPSLQASRYKAGTADRLVNAMDEWLLVKDILLFKDFDKMTPEVMAAAVRADATPPVHPIFAICRTLSDQAGALRRLFDQHLLHLKTDLLRTLGAELAVRKQKKNILFFDDLLLRLRDALLREGGTTLAAAIRKQYKAALIDEFQDTDPVQYAIFHAVFGGKDHSLFLIGDPKQAIYSFRGADIFAYMHAADTTQAGYTLEHNWRSEPGLIAAVNTLFSATPEPFVYEQIAFRPVKAAPATGRDNLTLHGKPGASLEWWFLPAGPSGGRDRPMSKEAARPLIAGAVSAEISRLVRLGREGLALIGQRPVGEGDMAVLVRTHREARLIQQSLQALQIASVLASEENVFDSHEARELHQVLQGIAWPGREDLVRGALATDMLGAGADALAQWLESDAGWSVRLDTFRQDHDLWKTRGFMRMFRILMVREGVRSRLLTFPDGERRLTNLLHLSEIIHQESISRNLDSQRLMRWFAAQRNREQRELLDEHLLRLESDADAVKVLTIHKSKGLEYPIVFCPFGWGSSRIVKGPFYFHDDIRNRELTCDLGSADQDRHRRRAERERLAENCRLLYVALTRARHRCYFAWGRINKTGSSAPAYLFHTGKAAAEAQWQEDLVGNLEKKMATLSDHDMQHDLARIAEGSGGTIRLEELPARRGEALPPRLDTRDLFCSRQFRGSIDPTWKVASYSLLVSAPPALLEQPDRDAVAPGSHAPEHPAPFSAPPRQDGAMAGDGGRTVFNFPGGTRAGIFLHELLEQFDFTEHRPDAIRRLVAEKLQLHGFDRQWVETLTSLLRNVAACALPRPETFKKDGAPLLTLSRISTSARINELEFCFPLQRISRQRLTDLLDGDELRETGLERLHFSPVRGFMRGFIDLVFQHEERFYLVDWKSNVLGSGIAEYAPANLRKVMDRHFYVLQSRLYLIALHQYLMLRQPDYDYDRHFGGIYYLFIRGMDPAWGPAYGVYADRPERRLVERLSRLLIPAA